MTKLQIGILSLAGACWWIMLAGGCRDRFVGDWATSTVGIIRDSVTLQPLADARVTYFDTTTSEPWLTYSSGAYQLATWGGGVRTVYCRRDGYFTKIGVSSTSMLKLVDTVDFLMVSAATAALGAE